MSSPDGRKGPFAQNPSLEIPGGAVGLPVSSSRGREGNCPAPSLLGVSAGIVGLCPALESLFLPRPPGLKTLKEKIGPAAAHFLIPRRGKASTPLASSGVGCSGSLAHGEGQEIPTPPPGIPGRSSRSASPRLPPSSFSSFTLFPSRAGGSPERRRDPRLHCCPGHFWRFSPRFPLPLMTREGQGFSRTFPRLAGISAVLHLASFCLPLGSAS